MWDAGKTDKYIRERTGKSWCLDVKRQGAENADAVLSQGDLGERQKRESPELLLLWVFVFSALAINMKRLCSLLKEFPAQMEGIC